ncbi:MAG: hypothetical protein K2Q18_16250 [Bdellovibrionales bacterium]|nr:hypothetical protein [Bdellovibrionales bacterium]
MKVISACLSLLVLSSVSFAGDGPSNSSITKQKSSECVLRVVQYFELQEGQTKDFSGTTNGEKCGFSIRHVNKILDSYEERSFHIKLNNPESGRYIWADMYSTETDVDYNISACEIQNESLKVEYTAKDKYKWKVKRKFALDFSKEGVSLSEKESGIWITKSSSKLNCQF